MTEELPDRPARPKGPDQLEGSGQPKGSDQSESLDQPDSPAAATPPTRPARPQYGEYATPQEQAKAIARSLPKPPPGGSGTRADTTTSDSGSAQPRAHRGTLFPGHDASPRATPTSRTTPAGGSTPAQQDRPFAPPRPSDRNPWIRETPARPAGTANRLATMILLALGLVYVLGGVPSYLELEQTLDAAYAQWGIGTYTSTALTSSIGISVVVGQFLVWLGAAYLSVRRLQVGKVAWWIPLVAAVLALAVSTALMAILLTSDPAFATFLTAQ